MKLLNNQNILIVGLGLMGGSYAKALKRLDFHIEAIDTNRESVDYARPMPKQSAGLMLWCSAFTPLCLKSG